MRTFRLVLVAVATAGLLGAATGLGMRVVSRQGSETAEPAYGGPFTLTEMTGKPVSEADLRGRPTVLYFGYTYCPEVCPTTLTLLTSSMRQMGGAASRLNVVFVTVDPQRDTAAEMRAYLSSFDPRIRGFTGTEAQVAAAAKAYHIYYRRVPGDGGSYTMDHTATVLLLDSAGRLSGTVDYGENAKDALAKLTALAGKGGA